MSVARDGRRDGASPFGDVAAMPRGVASLRLRLALAVAGCVGLAGAFLYGNPDDWTLEPMCNRLGQHWIHHGEWFHRAGDARAPVLVCVSGSGGPQEFLVEALPR